MTQAEAAEQPDVVDASDASSSSGSDSDYVYPQDQEDLVRATLETRSAHWTIQLEREKLTPLLRKEMKDGIKAVSKALRVPRFCASVSLMERLDKQQIHIREHWCKVYKSPEVRSVLLVYISQYEVFFTGMLYEDYMLQPVNPLEALLPGNHWFSRVANLVQQHRQVDHDSKSDEEEEYQSDVLFPLEEMNLGSLAHHAENRLCAAAAARQTGAKCTGAYVSQLINACDWRTLAETLTYDRQLVTDLCSEAPVYFNWKWLVLLLPKMLGKIDDIQRTYYTNLSSPTNYTISEHAADLSARHSSSGHPGRVPPARIPKVEKQTSHLAAIKGRLRLLADGLNLTFRKDGPAASSAAYPEEKNQLLFQDDDSIASSSMMRADEKSLLD